MDNTPHVPFFLPIIEELECRGYSLLVTARDSYQVRELARFLHLPCDVVGRHYGKNKLIKLLGTVFRAFQLAPIAIREKPALAVSHCSRSQLLSAICLRIPSVILDDYEYSQTMGPIRPTWMIVPSVIPEDTLSMDPHRILRYPGIKEDVYVPRFRPDLSLKARLGLGEAEILVVLRPPATEAHYHNSETHQLFSATMRFLIGSANLKVVVLPRNGRQRTALYSAWPDAFASGKFLMPQEVLDGLSLICSSDLVISGGGTMNREAAALGVPVYSIFGGRIGAVDRYLIEHGRLRVIEREEHLRSRVVLARRNRNDHRQYSDTSAMKVIVDHLVQIVDLHSHAPQAAR